MIDLRIIGASKTIEAMDINDSNIKMLLSSIGINPTKETINIVTNYLKSNNLKLTMRNLIVSLKNHSLIAVNDCRTITSNNKVHLLNYPIQNFENFNNSMHSLGYSDFTSDFLLKTFDDITINISRDMDSIQAITAYDSNNAIISIPQELLDTIINDINESNK